MIIALLVGLAAVQPAPAPTHKIEATLAIEDDKEQGTWRFVVAGTTSLPDGVLLRGEFCIVDEFDDYKGGRIEGEEAMIDRRNKWLPKFAVKQGAFRAVYYQSARRPFSFRYRAKIKCAPAGQPPEVAAAVAAPGFEILAELDLRSPEKLERDFREAAQALSADLEQLLKRFGEVQEAFVRHRQELDRKAFQPVAWTEWKKGWRARLKDSEDRNDRRWEVENAWQEKQGKVRLGMLMGMLEFMVAEVCDPCFAGDATKLPQAQESFDAFVTDYARAIDGLAIDAPFDLPKLNNDLMAYSALFAEIAALVESRNGERWNVRAAALRQAARATLLRLADPKIVPKRGHEVLTGLTDACNEVFAACDLYFQGKAEAPSMAGLLKRHEERLRDLRALAEQR